MLLARCRIAGHLNVARYSYAAATPALKTLGGIVPLVLSSLLKTINREVD